MTSLYFLKMKWVGRERLFYRLRQSWGLLA